MIVEWVKQTLSKIFAPVIEAISSRIYNALEPMREAIHRALDEYNRTQKVSAEFLRAFDQTFGTLFGIVFALVVALNIAIAVITPLTAGLGTILLTLLLSLLLTLIIQTFAPGYTVPEKGEALGVTPGMSIAMVIELVGEFIKEKLGIGKRDSTQDVFKVILALILGAASAVFCGMGFIAAAGAELALEDATGITTGMYGTTLAFISFFVSLVGILTTPCPDVVLSITLALLGLILSGVGLLFSIISLIRPLGHRIPQIFGCNCASLVFTGLSMVTCIFSLEVILGKG